MKMPNASPVYISPSFYVVQRIHHQILRLKECIAVGLLSAREDLVLLSLNVQLCEGRNVT